MPTDDEFQLFAMWAEKDPKKWAHLSGKRLVHDKYGLGVVTRVRPSCIPDCAFEVRFGDDVRVFGSSAAQHFRPLSNQGTLCNDPEFAAWKRQRSAEIARESSEYEAWLVQNALIRSRLDAISESLDRLPNHDCWSRNEIDRLRITISEVNPGSSIALNFLQKRDLIEEIKPLFGDIASDCVYGLDHALYPLPIDLLMGLLGVLLPDRPVPVDQNTRNQYQVLTRIVTDLRLYQTTRNPMCLAGASSTAREARAPTLALWLTCCVDLSSISGRAFRAVLTSRGGCIQRLR
jgi:hypothetical protein